MYKGAGILSFKALVILLSKLQNYKSTKSNSIGKFGLLIGYQISPYFEAQYFLALMGFKYIFFKPWIESDFRFQYFQKFGLDRISDFSFFRNFRIGSDIGFCFLHKFLDRIGFRIYKFYFFFRIGSDIG